MFLHSTKSYLLWDRLQRFHNPSRIHNLLHYKPSDDSEVQFVQVLFLMLTILCFGAVGWFFIQSQCKPDEDENFKKFPKRFAYTFLLFSVWTAGGLFLAWIGERDIWLGLVVPIITLMFGALIAFYLYKCLQSYVLSFEPYPVNQSSLTGEEVLNQSEEPNYSSV